MAHGDVDQFLESFADAVPELVGMRARTSDLPRELGETALSLYFATIAGDHDRSRSDGIEHPEVDIRSVWQRVCEELVAAGRLSRDPRPDEIERLALAFELRVNPVWPMPEIGRTLRALRAAGLVLGLVSNAQFYTPLLFPALLGAEEHELGFHAELCAYSYRLGRAKPSTELFLEAGGQLRSRFGIEPAETLYVGNDMRNDIYAAQAAGCRTCLFAGDTRSLRMREDDPAVAGLEPDAVIRSLGELRAVLSLGGRFPHA
jgi:putative hydrolase of the HAD superfamily